ATSALSWQNAVQTMTLASNGSTQLSYNSVNATSALAVTTGATGTLASDVQTNLQTIPVLSGNEVQTITLVANGTTTLSFNGAASSALTVTTGATTLANVQTALDSISTLVGNYTATGSTGGPFTIVFKSALANTNVSQIVSSSTAQATVATVVDGSAAAINV